MVRANQLQYKWSSSATDARTIRARRSVALRRGIEVQIEAKFREGFERDSK